MKIVFMGTPEFAVASLDAIYNSNHNIAAVVTVPDKAAGRGKKIKSSAVKEYALSKDLPILQPEKLRDEAFVNKLKELHADLFIVVAFRMLPEIVWSIPPKGTFNIHGSLLPQYRGAAPINHAIINGEKETGLTTFMIDKEIDTGKIIMQKKINIAEYDDAGSLHDKLMELSKSIVIDTIENIESSNDKLIPQESLISKNSKLNFAPKIFKEDCHIKPDIEINKANLLIRGLSPYPAAFIILINPNGDTLSLKIFKSNISKEKSGVGKIFTDGKNYLAIGFKEGALELNDIQLQNKKRMKIKDFLRGYSINEEWYWM